MDIVFKMSHNTKEIIFQQKSCRSSPEFTKIWQNLAPKKSNMAMHAKILQKKGGAHKWSVTGQLDSAGAGSNRSKGRYNCNVLCWRGGLAKLNPKYHMNYSYYL